jgi:hypothetical protein
MIQRSSPKSDASMSSGLSPAMPKRSAPRPAAYMRLLRTGMVGQRVRSFSSV